MSRPANRPFCGVCATCFIKNGATSAGRTRWRSPACGASTIKHRGDITRNADLWKAPAVLRHSFETSSMYA